MTDTMQDTNEKIVATQWRVLGSLIDKPSDIHSLTHVLFDGERLKYFEYMRESYIADGMVTREGIDAEFGRVPPQLDVAGATNIKPLVRVLADHATRKMLQERAEQLRYLSKATKLDMSAIKSALHLEPVSAAEDGNIETGASKYLSTLREKRKKRYKFCRTGLRFLDNKIGGEWRPSTFHIVLGEPGSGKTAFALNSMLRMAEQGIETQSPDHSKLQEATGELPVEPIASLFISLEMEKEDLFARMLADITEINYKLILEGDRLQEDQLPLIDAAAERIQKLPIYILDRAAMPLHDILYNIKYYVDEYNVRVVFIDYLQIVNYSTGNIIMDLGYIAQQLKDLAKILKITIVMLSQVTESNEGIERIRFSRNPGQIADVVSEFVMEDGSASDQSRNGQLVLYKNRFGPLGMHAILFYGIYQRFESGV